MEVEGGRVEVHGWVPGWGQLRLCLRAQRQIEGCAVQHHLIKLRRMQRLRARPEHRACPERQVDSEAA